MISIMSLIVMSICTIMALLATTLTKKSTNDREKMSPFECGFDPMSSARIPFSLRFFLVTVIFLIFDVEIALLLPMTIINQMINMYSWSLVSMLFLMILLIGLFHEWNQGALDWAE
uniref:NADH-ubiquinone oxidoreductase chain 3 n=1 Tax=Tricholepidion gertschi TaxID=89825 RepID=Q85QS1_9INSE|nr:NADH dehydrogenase subunit 3 [Tricholepidion gertschi]AAO40215.1 NADH dehydrogenase subunit 3 [Tricholepidion gertschi]